MIKVLVVDDSAYSRQTIKNMLESGPGISVVGIASDGIDAMAKTLRLKPDLITLDFEMPEMDGFSFLRWLMKQKPTPVIMVSSYSDSKTVFKALELGALDFISKPTKKASIELRNIEKDLLHKVRAIETLNMRRLTKNIELLGEKREKREEHVSAESREFGLVAIGSSTGGPPAIQLILSSLPQQFPVGIVISQHMPRGFTKPFAERLDLLSKLNIKEAENGDEIEPGKVLICPGGYHMLIKKRGNSKAVVLKNAEYEDRYIPSVDTMMSSASEIYGGNMVGVVLTGMGNDGRKGMLEIKSKGGYTIAESEETAVVFGMPAEVINAGAALRILPLNEIAGEIINVVKG